MSKKTFYDNVAQGIATMLGKEIGSASAGTQGIQLSAKDLANAKKRVLNYDLKAVSRTREDIKTWKAALTQAEHPETPKNFRLQQLYNLVADDALLTSQIENRKNKLYGVSYALRGSNGEVNEVETEKLQESGLFRDITNAILDSTYYGYSLIELQENQNIDKEQFYMADVIPRTNVVPRLGAFYKDYAEDKFIKYREIREFGIWVLEFDTKGIGLLNKAVKHVLMKDFAQSCWAELCEIYGIPPRYLKTNTQDTEMLKRGAKMMADMGAAAWMIIDNEETLEFADGIQTTGDVYKNLIQLCNNENSMLISGAIIAQDTVNGSRSKDESAQGVLWEKVLEDMVMVQDQWNRFVIPSLRKLGVISGDVKFKFDIPEDLKELWGRVVQALPHYDIDPVWVKEKFGIEVTGKKAPQTGLLNHGESFFV
jgi:phage gp29-like protein